MKLCLLLLLTAGLLGAAGSIFDRLHAAFPDSAQADRAVMLLHDQNYSEVQQMLTAQTLSTPDARAQLLALKGIIEFLSSDVRHAVADLTAASSTAPLSDADSFTLAMALVKVADDDRARTVLTTLDRKNPDRPLYLYWLGRLDYDQRRYQEAVARLTRAARLDPESSRTWDSLGLAFDMQGEMQPALDAFEKAATLNRKQPHPSAWPPHNLGYLLLRMNQPEAAVAALEESLHYDPSLAVSSYHLGRANEKLGRTADAVAAYKQAIANDTTSTDACYSLAQLYRKLQQQTQADEMFAEYRRRRALPDHP